MAQQPDDMSSMFSGLNLNEKNYMYSPNYPNPMGNMPHNNMNMNMNMNHTNYMNQMPGHGMYRPDMNPQYNYLNNPYPNSNMNNYDYNMMMQEQWLRNMQQSDMSPQE